MNWNQKQTLDFCFAKPIYYRFSFLQSSVPFVFSVIYRSQRLQDFPNVFGAKEHLFCYTFIRDAAPLSQSAICFFYKLDAQFDPGLACGLAPFFP